jgi:hypothetical protein
MKSATSHWQVESRRPGHPLTATPIHCHLVTSSSITSILNLSSYQRISGYSDDEQGPKHAFPGQRVSDRPSAVNTSMSSVTLTTGHGISTLLGLETCVHSLPPACILALIVSMPRRCIGNAYNNLTQVRRLFLQHSTIVSLRYLPQLPYLEELGIEGNRIASFAHAPCLPALISVNITGDALF